MKVVAIFFLNHVRELYCPATVGAYALGEIDGLMNDTDDLCPLKLR